MIKILLMLIVLLFPVQGLSQTWYPTNQVTVAWDTVTTVDDGGPIPQGQSITYTLFSRSGSETGPIVEGGTVLTTQALISFSVPGKYFIGVRSNLMEGQVKLAESAIAWSYEISAVQNGNTFGIIFSKLPSKPTNLRVFTQ